ncbi:hypothetical protein E2320_003759 [Naja naja]|nr:hypothetical protein E2320_003759 [Naja naja]
MVCIIFGKLLTLCPPTCLPWPRPSYSHSQLACCQCCQCPHAAPDILPLSSQKHCRQSLPCVRLPTLHPQRLLTTSQERPGIHVGWKGGQAWLAGCCLEHDSGRGGERKPWSPEVAPLEHGERLQGPFTLRKSLLPSCLISQHLFSAYRRSHILAALSLSCVRGKSEEAAAGGKVGETGGGSPFPASQDCLQSLLFPFVGVEPDVFSLAQQSWLRKHHHRVSVQELYGEGYRRLCPPPPWFISRQQYV